MMRLDLTYAEIMLLYFYIRSTMRFFFFEWDNENMLLKHKKLKKKLILKDILGQLLKNINWILLSSSPPLKIFLFKP